MWLLLFLLSSAYSLNPNPKVLVISLDGFRYDLLNETLVPSIYRFAERGTWFRNGMRPQHLTYTTPNHLAIVTGLHEENHKIIANRFWDSRTNKYHDYYNFTGNQDFVANALDAEAYAGDPIWLTNERAGNDRRSSAFYWPFCDIHFELPPHKPALCKRWVGPFGSLSSKDWESQGDEIINEFTKDDDPSNLVLWYIDQPDDVLHFHGFYDGHFERVIKELDHSMGRFFNKLEARGLLNQMTVVLLADHGHSEIRDYKSVFCVKDHITVPFHYGDLQIYTRSPEEAEEIYRNLTRGIEKGKFGIKVHRRKDFPEHLFYRKSPFTGDLIFEMEIGYFVNMNYTSEEFERLYGEGGEQSFNQAQHGYVPENAEMRPILIFNGPKVFKNKKVEEIPENIDLYHALSDLLEIPASPNDGQKFGLKEAIDYNSLDL